MLVGFWRRAAFSAAVMLLSSMVSAADSWSGASGIDNNWNTPTNWSGGAPTPNADLVFPVTTALSSNNNITGLQINSLTISGSNYALTGDSLTLGSATPGSGSVIVITGAANNSAAFNMTLGGATANTQFFTINTGGALTLSGQFSGSAGLTKQGAGMLILTGDNSGYTGPFTIGAGIVQIQNASALGGGASTPAATVQTNSQLQLNNVSISNNLLLNGPGPSSNGSLLNLAGTNTLSGGIELDSDTTLGATAGTMVLNGPLSDNGAGHNLTIAGNGTIILGSATGNTYRGTTTINGGVLVIANTSGSATGTSILPNAVSINTGGTLQGDGIISQTVTLNGILDPGFLSGGGMLTGTLTWNSGGVGGVMDMALGADALSSDHLTVGGALLKGTAGNFEFNFNAASAVPGAVYDLVQFTSTTFAPGDFSFISNNPQLAGSFSYDSAAAPTELLFTVAPEPSTGALLASVVMLLAWRSRKSGRNVRWGEWRTPAGGGGGAAGARAGARALVRGRA